MRSQRFSWVPAAISGVLVVSAIVIAGLLLAIGPANPSATPTALPSPAESQRTSSAEVGASPSARAVTVTLTRPGPAATLTRTPVPPPTSVPTLTSVPGLPSPTISPVITVIAEAGSGPGVSESFDLPEGQYRVTFHAGDGFELVVPVVETGDCGSEPLFDGEANAPFDGSAVYWSTGCRVHFEILGARGGWSLGVETLGGEAARTVPLTASGDGPDLLPLLDLPPGEYLIVVEAQGMALVITPVVVDGECLERPILVATAPGTYQAQYPSAGCLVIFEVTLADSPWTLTITTAP